MGLHALTTHKKSSPDQTSKPYLGANFTKLSSPPTYRIKIYNYFLKGTHAIFYIFNAKIEL